MAAPAKPAKKKLSSIIAGQQAQPRPTNYPPASTTAKTAPQAAPKAASPKVEPAKPAVSKAPATKPAKRSTRKAAVKPPPRERKVISVDLSMQQFRDLRDIADELGCSRTEAIRALVNLAVGDDAMHGRLLEELEVEGIRRPSGFAARTA